MKSMVVLVLCAVVATASSNPTVPDCVICSRGKCLTPAAFTDDPKILKPNQVTVYYNDNIMYYDDEGTLRAINLDTNTFKQIPKINPIKQFEVDQITGDLYYYEQLENQITIHKYQPKTNETIIITVPNPYNKKPPTKIKIYNGTLYFIRDDKFQLEKGLNVFDGTTLQRVAALENFHVSDIVFDKLGKMYIKSAQKVYILKKNENGVEEISQIDQPTSFSPSSIISNANGEIYVFDTKFNAIYHLDPATDKFIEIGTMKDTFYGRVKLDKNNNIILNLSSLLYYKVSNYECIYKKDEDYDPEITVIINEDLYIESNI